MIEGSKYVGRFVINLDEIAVEASLAEIWSKQVSPVTSKPASRGRIKTSHSEARDSYHFCFLDQGISATS